MMKYLISALVVLQGARAFAFEYLTPALQPPEYFEYGVPSELDLDEEKLQHFIHTAEEKDTGALLILRKNKLVVEKYWREDSFEYPLQSISKSLLSLAAGCLIDEGKLQLDDRVSKWYKDWAGDKGKITIRHLLTHTSGLRENTDDMEKSKNQLKYALDLPVETPPGEDYFYSEAGTLILGEILHKITETPVDEYVNRRLFKPLDIRRWSWKKDPSGTVLGNGGAAILPRELLKIGSLLLQNGRWKDETIIPEKYLEQALKNSAKKDSYGFLFNLITNGFFAAGKYGQFLVVLPRHEMIIVRLRTPKKGEDNFSEMHWVNMPREIRDFVILPKEVKPTNAKPAAKKNKAKKS
jgi:CubicO group peptidase (beta-lactamase class C family)